MGDAAQRHDASLPVEGELGDAAVVPGVRVGEHGLGARRHPAHRRAEHPRRYEHRALLREAHELHPEAAADLRGHHAQPLFLDAERRGDQGAHQVHALALGVEPIRPACGIVTPDRGAGLDRRGPHPVVGALDPDYVGGAFERCRRRLGVAELTHHRDFLALARVQHRGQGFVVDLHALRRVGGGFDRCRHHHRHRVADKAHLLDRQHVAGRSMKGGAVAALDRARAVERSRALREEVLPTEDASHAVTLPRRARLEARDSSVRMRRAHEDRMQAVRGVEILHVAARSPQQALVLEAVHAGPRPEQWRVHSTPAGPTPGRWRQCLTDFRELRAPGMPWVAARGSTARYREQMGVRSRKSVRHCRQG